MLNKDFYGKNSFVWWTGVVEDRDDPLQIGSVRVRIIGLHSENPSLVPTESLPWAQVLQPVTGAGTTSGPREGDWVFGFFQDGDYAQIPVVVGIFPGIESVQSQTIYKEVAAKKGAEKTPVSSQTDRVVGEPTSVRMSRGVLEGTLTNVLNQNLSHACDVKGPIKTAIDWANATNAVTMKALNDTIKSLATSLGQDGSGLISIAINTLKKIRTFLQWIQSILRDVQKWSNTVRNYITVVRAVIDYINNLPNRLQKFLSECLTKVTAGIMVFIGSLFSVSGIEDFGLQSLFTEVGNLTTELGKTASSVLQTAVIPGQFIEALVNPATDAQQEKTKNVLDGFIGYVADNGQAINNQTRFKKTTTLP